MDTKIKIFMLSILLFNCGCFTYKSYVPINLKEVSLDVPLSIRELSIDDRRTEISKEDDIKIPFMSGLKKKSWKHFPKLSIEHKSLIEKTIDQNFSKLSKDSADLSIIINVACKEFEQTGKSEIERVYLNTESILKTNQNEFHSQAVDTFHYESIDASNKHFEKFYQTSLQNNIVRNIVALRNAYFNSEVKEIECFDNSHKKSISKKNIEISITGKDKIESIELTGELEQKVSQIWEFKISTNQNGELTYIEAINDQIEKKEELRAIMKYLYKLKISKLLHQNLTQNCWKLEVKNHEH